MKTKLFFPTFLLLWSGMFVQGQQATVVDDGTAEYEQSKKFIYGHAPSRLKLLEAACAKGHADALVDLGLLHHNGFTNLLKVNYAEAQKLWLKAAEKQHPMGYYNLGALYLNGKGVERNIDSVIHNWEQSAKLNHVNAMVSLAELYFNKKNHPRNPAKAYFWYKEAVDNGATGLIPNMLTAQTMVEAEQVLQKKGVTDFEKGVAYFDLEMGKEAIVWLEKAAEKGDDKAMTALGLAIEKWGTQFNKNKDIEKWFRKAAKKGNEKAMFLLGKMYEEGKTNYYLKKDFIKALDWYEKAAEKGDIDALMAIGWLYYSGRHDVRPNNIYSRSGPKKWTAWNYFEKVATQGHPEGYYAQGFMLEHGHFFVKDSKKYGYADARGYYEKAVELGHEKAEQALAKYNQFFEYTMGVKHFERKEYVQAKEFFEAADKKSGHLIAIKYLARIHEEGLGIEKDKKTAFNYYLRSARSGDIASKSKVIQLYDNDPKYTSLVTEYQKAVAKSNKEALERQLAQLEKQKQEEAAYNEMLYQQRLNRGRVTIGSQWEGFTYDAATRNSYNRTSAENNARIQTANYKRFLDYKFGK